MDLHYTQIKGPKQKDLYFFILFYSMMNELTSKLGALVKNSILNCFYVSGATLHLTLYIWVTWVQENDISKIYILLYLIMNGWNESAWLSSDQCSIVIVLFLKRFQESLCLTNNIAFLVNTNYDTLCSSNRLCFTCRKLLSWVNFSDSLQTKLCQMFFCKINIMLRELTLRTGGLEPRA